MAAEAHRPLRADAQRNRDKILTAAARVFTTEGLSAQMDRIAKEAGVGASKYNDIHRIVTNLAVFDVKGPDDTVRLLSVHPGVTVAEVQEATGFDLGVSDPASRRLPGDASRPVGGNRLRSPAAGPEGAGQSGSG